MTSNENDLNEIMQRALVTELSGPAAIYNHCFLFLIFNNFAAEIENLEVNDTDIWVTSFPKSGTTWTQELVYLLATDFDYEKAKEKIVNRFPFLETCTLRKFEKTADLNEKDFNRSQSIKNVKNYKDTPRFIKTHLPWHLLPKSIQSKEKRPKIIHVIRNPKDVCTSYYHHYKRTGQLSERGNFEDFVKLFLADKVIYAPYWEHTFSYWNQKIESNVLIVKYEDMKKDLKSVVNEVAKFLGKTIKDDQMEKLLNHLSFESMKDNPAVNYQDGNNKSNVAHMRKGIVGDYKNLMTPELIQEFDEWINKNNKGIIF